VVDGGSTDGTLEALELLAEVNPKVKLFKTDWDNAPLTQEFGNIQTHYARSFAEYSMHFILEADEILDPVGYDEIRSAVACGSPRVFHYVNFWLDAQHKCPWGDERKLHLIPRDAVFSVHGEAPASFIAMRESAPMPDCCITYHYSALRRREAFIAKCKVMGRLYNMGYADQALMKSEATGCDFMPLYLDRTANSTPFTGRHPPCMHDWLTERGWKLTP